MATAVTVTEIYDQTLTGEGYEKIGYLQGGPGWTWTPTNSSGKTIRIASLFNNTEGNGTAIAASVSNGVITITGITLGDEFTIVYTMT